MSLEMDLPFGQNVDLEMVIYGFYGFYIFMAPPIFFGNNHIISITSLGFTVLVAYFCRPSLIACDV